MLTLIMFSRNKFYTSDIIMFIWVLFGYLFHLQDQPLMDHSIFGWSIYRNENTPTTILFRYNIPNDVL